MVFKYITGLLPPLAILTGTVSSSTVGVLLLTHELLMNPYIKNIFRAILPTIPVPSGHVMTSQILFVMVPSKITLAITALTCAQRICVRAATPRQVCQGWTCGTILGLAYKFIF